MVKSCPFLLVILLICIFHSSKSQYIHFIEIGDWGSGTDIQESVAATMNNYAKANPLDFIVSLGDNFYEVGVDTVDSYRFQTSFKDIYIIPYKSLNVNWYLIAGNHDHIGSVDAQIAYSQKFSQWNFPDAFYVKTFQVSNTTTLSLVMIDTTLLCSLYNSHYAYDTFNTNIYNRFEQLLDQCINSTYILVHGHHPIYSKSRFTSNCLAEHIQPLLIKYNVTAYISGHDHTLQHLYDTKSRINHFISAAAGKIHTGSGYTTPSNIESKLYWDGTLGTGVGGFLVFNVTDENIQYKFVTTTNNVIYLGTFGSRTANISTSTSRPNFVINSGLSCLLKYYFLVSYFIIYLILRDI